MEFIRVIYTDEDVKDIAEDLGIDRDTAFARAESWGKHIENNISSIAGEQLRSCIEHDTP